MNAIGKYRADNGTITTARFVARWFDMHRFNICTSSDPFGYEVRVHDDGRIDWGGTEPSYPAFQAIRDHYLRERAEFEVFAERNKVNLGDWPKHPALLQTWSECIPSCL